MLNQKIIKTITTYKIKILLISLFSFIFSNNDYQWPTNASNTLTGVFGDIRPFRYHTGIDIRTYGVNGHDVYAIQDGYISRILVSTSGYGKTIYIKMNDGNTSVYAHLDRFNEKLESIKEKLQSECKCYTIDKTFSENQIPILKGDIIGYTGDTGGISGPHLHFEIRNKNGKPFNPLLTNYKIKDTIHPIPEKIIFTNLNKDSYINGIPEELELNLRKISDEKYVCDDIISIVGEFGVSLEVYDKINSQPFNFGVYNIRLDIDKEKKYEAKYNYVGFEEGPKIYNERDYCKHTNERRKVYTLYRKNSTSPSSFIKEKYYNSLNFKDSLYHKGKITVSDYNKNEVEIDFTFLSDKIRNSQFDITKNKYGIIIEYNDDTIKDLNIQLADKFNNEVKYTNMAIERISESKYFIKNPKFKFDVICIQPVYNTGALGATQFYSFNDNAKLDGEISLSSNEKGVFFEFTEKEFSNKAPVLGLLLNNVLYKYPLNRIKKNKLVSELFYPLELRGLTKASIFYLDSSIYQLSSEIYSNISIPELPFFLNKDLIEIKSDGNKLYDISFSEQDITETFIYIKDINDPNPKIKTEYYYGPFIMGPEDITLKSKFDIIYKNRNPQLGIYKYDKHNEKWKFLDNKSYDNGIGASVKAGGVFAVIKDTNAPVITRVIPKIGSTYRHDHFEYIQFYIEDEMSGIYNEKNIKVFLDEEELIFEYNPYRKVVFYKLNKNLDKGSHTIRIEAEDNSENIKLIDGIFYIK